MSVPKAQATTPSSLVHSACLVHPSPSVSPDLRSAGTVAAQTQPITWRRSPVQELSEPLRFGSVLDD